MESIRDNIILNNKSRHFQIMYYFSPYYSISHNEVVEGNISFTSLSISELDCESLLNILIQSLLSVGSFHNLVGYIHRNCICKNFLYQINSDDTDGYYTYILDGERYYLKSCRYNVMISNFEKCKEITEVALLLLEDYKSIVKDFSVNNNIMGTSVYNVFMNKLNKGDGFYKRLEQFLYTSSNDKGGTYIAKVLLKDILLLCLEFFPDIFVKVLPMNGKMLNANPFELYQEPKATVM